MDRTPKANERDWFVFLPNHLTEQTIDISSEGINAQAFRLLDALEALTHFRGQQWVVYGGDFYRQGRGGRWRPTYETWYVEHEASEPIPVFIERSIEAATAAIAKRRERLGEDADTERVVLVAAKPRPNDLAQSY
jgi:hypothetical protein